MIHLTGYDGTDVWDLTRAEIEGRAPVDAGDQGAEPLRARVREGQAAHVRDDLGVRDTRKIEGRYNLTEHDVRNQARFDDSIGIFPEFIDGYGVLVLPTTGRYFEIPYGVARCRRRSRTCWWPAAASPATRSRTPPCAA